MYIIIVYFKKHYDDVAFIISRSTNYEQTSVDKATGLFYFFISQEKGEKLWESMHCIWRDA